jgi:DNA-directed RNA polymerase specialized sigma24 family protein
MLMEDNGVSRGIVQPLGDTLRRGGEIAVNALLDSYGRRLHGYFRVMLCDDDATTCALTNTIIMAVSQISRLSDDTRLAAWLFALARQECHHYRPARHPDDDPATLRAADSATSPRRAGTADQRVEALALTARLALLRLDPDDREILVLPACRLSPAEVATLFGLGEQAAGRRTERACSAYQRVLATTLNTSGRASELASMALTWAGEGLPREIVLAFCTSPGYEHVRSSVLSLIPLLAPDGFPLIRDLGWPAGARATSAPAAPAAPAAAPRSTPATIHPTKRGTLIFLSVALPAAFAGGFGAVTAYEHATATAPAMTSVDHTPSAHPTARHSPATARKP